MLKPSIDDLGLRNLISTFLGGKLEGARSLDIYQDSDGIARGQLRYISGVDYKILTMHE